MRYRFGLGVTLSKIGDRHFLLDSIRKQWLKITDEAAHILSLLCSHEDGLTQMFRENPKAVDPVKEFLDYLVTKGYIVTCERRDSIQVKEEVCEDVVDLLVCLDEDMEQEMCRVLVDRVGNVTHQLATGGSRVQVLVSNNKKGATEGFLRFLTLLTEQASDIFALVDIGADCMIDYSFSQAISKCINGAIFRIRPTQEDVQNVLLRLEDVVFAFYELGLVDMGISFLLDRKSFHVVKTVLEFSSTLMLGFEWQYSYCSAQHDPHSACLLTKGEMKKFLKLLLGYCHKNHYGMGYPEDPIYSLNIAGPSRSCNHPVKKLAMDCEGNLYPCEYLLEGDYRILHGGNLDNLLNKVKTHRNVCSIEQQLGSECDSCLAAAFCQYGNIVQSCSSFDSELKQRYCSLQRAMVEYRLIHWDDRMGLEHNIALLDKCF